LVRNFPPIFLWGAATSSYQLEGANDEGGREACIWDAIPGKVSEGHTGQLAADHDPRMAQDVELMSSLGLQAYRFAIAWPRVLPDGYGEVNEKGLDFYDRLVDTLLAHGIQPFVTLYHWGLPSSLERVGGWTNRQTAYAFADYAEVVARRLGDRVSHWITLNDPWSSAWAGYGSGCHAPGGVECQAALDAAHHLLLAHGLAVPRLRHSVSEGAQVGLATLLARVYGEDERPETVRDVRLAHDFFNGWFLGPIYTGAYPADLFARMGLKSPPVLPGDLATISAPLDFLAVNNYASVQVHGQALKLLADQVQVISPVPGASHPGMAWEIDPDGLRDLLVDISRRYPVRNLYITENSAAIPENWHDCATLSDPWRIDALTAYIGACSEALMLGVPVRGYFAWSPMDTFERGEGCARHTGLIHIDASTQRRVIKESGHWYASLIRAFREQYGLNARQIAYDPSRKTGRISYRVSRSL
jgi:beta-glucosidase